MKFAFIRGAAMRFSSAASAAVEGGDILESGDGGRTWSRRYDAR